MIQNNTFLDSNFKKDMLNEVLAFRGFSDGGVGNQASWASDGVAACGWVLEGAFSFSSDAVLQWSPLVQGSIFLGYGFTSFESELHGVEALTQSLLQLLHVEGISARVSDWVQIHLN